jgi:hypothetical protein
MEKFILWSEIIIIIIIIIIKLIIIIIIIIVIIIIIFIITIYLNMFVHAKRAQGAEKIRPKICTCLCSNK